MSFLFKFGESNVLIQKHDKGVLITVDKEKKIGLDKQGIVYYLKDFKWFPTKHRRTSGLVDYLMETVVIELPDDPYEIMDNIFGSMIENTSLMWMPPWVDSSTPITGPFNYVYWFEGDHLIMDNPV